MPTSTSYYGFPVPVDNDPADAPHDFLALAQKIEDTLRTGYTMQGDLILGNVDNGNARIFMLRKLDGVDAYQGQVYIMTGGALALNLLKNGVEVNRLRINPDGSMVNAIGGGIQRPIPYATYATTRPLTLTSAGSGSVVVTFPSSRFTQPPAVFVQPVNNTGSYFGYITTVSATQVTVGARHFDNTAASVSITLNVFAIQSTPSGMEA